MKYIFIGLFYFGWWNGWSQMDSKVFDSFDDCSAYINDLGDQLRFCADNNCHGDWPSDWHMECSPIIPDAKDD